jgi:predicted ATPase/DNA-binding SARP family transcriptional activator
VLVRLLGPVEVVVDGAVRTPAGKRERALVALLALAGGEAVPADVVTVGLWGALVPPAGALDALVERIRADWAGAVLEAEGGGLRLVLARSDVDALEAEALADAAREQQPAESLPTLDRALALWRGPVLSGVDDVPFARPHVERLTELYSRLVEERYEVLFQLGRHAEVVDDLRAATREHPTRERLWGQLMTALSRDHRFREALEVYAEARAVLADELGIEPSEALQRLEAAILLEEPGRDPALGDVAVPRPAARLPVPRTPTFGREHLVERIRHDLLDPHARLVTLTGLGGMGKTRVAVVAAARLRDLGDREVLYVEVTAGESADDVVAMVTALVGEPGDVGPDRRDRVVLLDNADACPDGASAVSRVLEAAPAVTLLVTCRVPLRLAGEHVVAVGPLEVPAVGASIADITANPAAQLFTRVARQADPNVALSGREEELAYVCRLLDGVPLALELAAARVRLVGVDGLRESLESGLELLRTTSPDVPERQRALASTIAWSYDRLEEPARRLCRLLTMFEQSFTLEAVEAVAVGGGDVVDGLTELMEAGLIRSLASRVRIGFEMPSNVRSYVRALVVDRRELDPARLSLASYLLGNITHWQADLDRADGPLAVGRFEDVGRDVHASVVACLQLGRIDDGVALTLAAGPFWVASGELRQGLARSLHTLTYVGRQSAEAGALHLLAGQLAYHLTDYATAVEHLETAIAVAEPLGDEATVGASRCWLGAALLVTGDADRGRELVQLGIEAVERLDLYPMRATALSVLAISYAVAGEFDKERATHLARLDVTRAHGDVARTADALSILAEIALDEADAGTAHAYAEEALAIAHPTLPMEAREALISLARAQVAEGDLATAAETLQRAFDAAARIGQSLAIAQCYRVAGCLAAARGRAAQAVRLYAAAQRLAPSPNGTDDPVEGDLAGGLELARSTLGHDTAAREWTLGSALPNTRLHELFRDVVERAAGAMAGA